MYMGFYDSIFFFIWVRVGEQGGLDSQNIFHLNDCQDRHQNHHCGLLF